MNMKTLGVVHSVYKNRVQAPRQGGTIAEIEVSEKYEEGLKDMETFSHLHVFYWLHQSKGFTLSVKTHWDSKPHGLFATRSPDRPNPLGYSVVRLVERKGNILKVEGLDAIEGTKIIDIKPYIPRIDLKHKANSGWLERMTGC